MVEERAVLRPKHYYFTANLISFKSVENIIAPELKRTTFEPEHSIDKGEPLKKPCFKKLISAGLGWLI